MKNIFKNKTNLFLSKILRGILKNVGDEFSNLYDKDTEHRVQRARST